MDDAENRPEAKSGIGHLHERAISLVRRGAAHFWRGRYIAQTRFYSFVSNRSGLVTVGLAIVLAITTFALRPTLDLRLSSSTADEIGVLQSVILTIGGALIGAAAIAFSLVMFAMQVNVEKMPHGLFRKFSTDARLLGAFGASFLVAVGVTLAPTQLTTTTASLVVIGCGWAIFAILFLLLYAYSRALRLISPAEQLRLVVRTAAKDLKKWALLGEQMRPLLEESADRTQPFAKGAPERDLALTRFYRTNSRWTEQALRSLGYATTFSRRFAEVGDHEVVEAALGAVVAINTAYVRAKGRTFFAQHLMFDNPLVTDGFVNTTLEHLRKNVRIALTRGDEQAIELNFRCLASLAHLYLAADYGEDHSPRTHAHIASGYLSQAVEAVAPHNMPDVLMEGVRLLGNTSQAFLAFGQTTELTSISSSISVIGGAGIARVDHRPVTKVAMAELTKLVFNLLRTTKGDVRHAMSTVTRQIGSLVLLYLRTPDGGPLETNHSTYLAPYYSGTTHEALLSWLHDLANALLDTSETNSDAKIILRNIAEWSDKLNQSEKEIFLEAIARKSKLTFDVVHWIAGVSKVLWACSQSKACDEHCREKLQKNGLWLASVLSFAPDDTESVHLLEAYQFTETLFDVAVEAHQRADVEIADRVSKLLLGWALGGARHQIGWGTFGKSLRGIAALSVLRGTDQTLAHQLHTYATARGIALEPELREQTASELRRRVERSWEYRRHSFSHIDQALQALDGEKVEKSLLLVADWLWSPPRDDAASGDDSQK